MDDIRPTNCLSESSSSYNVELVNSVVGLGVFAQTALASHTIVLTEKPVLVIPRIITELEKEQFITGLQQDFTNLPINIQDEILSLSTNGRAQNGDDLMHQLMTVIEHNAMPLGRESNLGGLFPKCARFNHSCMPSAMYQYDTENDVMNIIMLRPVMPHEEICVSYLQNLDILSYTERKQLIRNELGFDCMCPCCCNAETNQS